MDGERELTDIAGIGPARAEQLRALGIRTVAQLVAEDAGLVALALDGVGVETVEGWQSAAHEAESGDPATSLGMTGGREEAVEPGAVGRERALGRAAPGLGVPPADDKPAAESAEPGSSGVDHLSDCYEEGRWRGLRQWRCLLCPFDTLAGEAVVREHVVKMHIIGGSAEAPPEIFVARR